MPLSSTVILPAKPSLDTTPFTVSVSTIASCIAITPYILGLKNPLSLLNNTNQCVYYRFDMLRRLQSKIRICFQHAKRSNLASFLNV